MDPVIRNETPPQTQTPRYPDNRTTRDPNNQTTRNLDARAKSHWFSLLVRFLFVSIFVFSSCFLPTRNSLFRSFLFLEIKEVPLADRTKSSHQSVLADKITSFVFKMILGSEASVSGVAQSILSKVKRSDSGTNDLS
jgi:hypothetical protein